MAGSARIADRTSSLGLSDGIGHVRLAGVVFASALLERKPCISTNQPRRRARAPQADSPEILPASGYSRPRPISIFNVSIISHARRLLVHRPSAPTALSVHMTLAVARRTDRPEGPPADSTHAMVSALAATSARLALPPHNRQRFCTTRRPAWPTSLWWYSSRPVVLEDLEIE